MYQIKPKSVHSAIGKSKWVMKQAQVSQYANKFKALFWAANWFYLPSSEI